jgi:hypothetical protein
MPQRGLPVLRKLGWFALIYGGSVLALGAVSLLIRFWIT